jgi:glycosyltransferase 2 family protein
VKKNLFSSVKKYLPFIGIIFLIYLIYSLDVNKVLSSLLSIKPIYIVFAISLTLPRILIRNFKWMLIQKEQKIYLTFLQSLKIFMIGYFYGVITPGFLGHLIRVPYMKEKTNEPYGKLFINIFIETSLGSIVQYVMVLLGLIFILEKFPQDENLKMIFIIFASFAIISALILLYFLKKDRGEKTLSFIIKYTIPKKYKNTYYSFINAFYNDFPRITRLIIPTFLTFLTYLLVFSQEYIIVMALGINIPFLSFMLLFPVANVAGYLPITFAGLGTREYTSIIIFSTLYSIDQADVLVFTLVGFIVTDVFAGFCGFLVSLTETRKKGISEIHKIFK